MKQAYLIFILSIFLNSCHDYKEDDYINNCNQKCKNERICIDAECQCPPNTYPFKYNCISKDSADLYYASLENTSIACEEQVLLYVPKKDVSTDPYNGVVIQFKNHIRGSLFFNNKYYKRTDGDIIYCENAFSRDTADGERCTPFQNYYYMELYGKFRSTDSLDAMIYFKDGNFRVQDSVPLIFVHNPRL